MYQNTGFGFQPPVTPLPYTITPTAYHGQVAPVYTPPMVPGLTQEARLSPVGYPLPYGNNLTPVPVQVQPEVTTPRSPQYHRLQVQKHAKVLSESIHKLRKSKPEYKALENAIKKQLKNDKMFKGGAGTSKAHLNKLADMALNISLDDLEDDEAFFKQFCRCYQLYPLLTEQLAAQETSEWARDIQRCKVMAGRMEAIFDHLTQRGYVIESNSFEDFQQLKPHIEAASASCVTAEEANRNSHRMLATPHKPAMNPHLMRSYRQRISGQHEREKDQVENSTRLMQLRIACDVDCDKNPSAKRIYKTDDVNDLRAIAADFLSKPIRNLGDREVFSIMAACRQMELQLGIALLSNQPEKALEELKLCRELSSRKLEAFNLLMTREYHKVTLPVGRDSTADTP